MSFYRFGHPPLFGTLRETPLSVEISLTNVSLGFSELFPNLLFLKKINQLKTINMS